ncbi:EF-hand domain protein [Raphanus sativus]|nr:EF-hand domain protein [Raphanus sativus]
MISDGLNRAGKFGVTLYLLPKLLLINSVIVSLSNFWMAAFRLPSGCIKEIECLCSAFLWSGPMLNGKKAKIAWTDISKLKIEGGLGIRPLKEINLEILREGGNIDLGIPSNATVAGSRRHKRRYHRVPMLNRVEAEIEKYKANLSQEEDVSLWKNEKERTLLLATVLSRLKNFSAMKKLKKMALRVIAERLSEEEIGGLKELFRMIDTDNSGTITFEELKDTVKRVGADLMESEIQELLRSADVDENGSIDYGEFLAATMHLNKLERERRI